ncbi:hypothetical protein E2C01_060265 [Portunus trituberculatus]|uniref:Uncharacterized protein n=1 Tax=Portunus trituberculatus TaxID=210409 RepID=A0A5B7H1S9_PORTR|nr:hypothetical protein [Portunus trituberculatus]
MCSIPGLRHLLQNGVDGVYFPACLSNVTHAAASCEAPSTGNMNLEHLLPGGSVRRGVLRCANGDTRVHIEQRRNHSLNTPPVQSTKARVHITQGRHYATYAAHAQTIQEEYKYTAYSFDLYRQKAVIMQGRHASRGRHGTAFKHQQGGGNQKTQGSGTSPLRPLFASRPADFILFTGRGRHQAAVFFLFNRE